MLVKGLTKSEKYPDGYNLGDGSEAFGEMLKEFMKKTSEEIDTIEKMLPKNTNIDAAIKAKADFYKFNNKKLKMLPANFKLNKIQKINDNSQIKLFDTNNINQ